MNKPTDFAYYLTNYMTTYLSGQKNVSINTVRSYRDTFKLLILYCTKETSLPVGKIEIRTVNKDLICGFVNWLLTVRGNGFSTANQRLAAIHAFFKYLQSEEPKYMLQYQQILSIPFKRMPKVMVGYLAIDEVKQIFAQPDKLTKQGRRNLALMCTLYDSGARVQELCDLRVCDLYLQGNPHLMLTGKGNKLRYSPITKNTALLLSEYISENQLNTNEQSKQPLFFNQRHEKMTRAGISYILAKYADEAREQFPQLSQKITPHTFRHSKAMHLCQAGVDIIYIRDILGHVDLATTEIYARLNIESIRDSLENAYPELTTHDMPDWSNDNNLMKMLSSL